MTKATVTESPLNMFAEHKVNIPNYKGDSFINLLELRSCLRMLHGGKRLRIFKLNVEYNNDTQEYSALISLQKPTDVKWLDDVELIWEDMKGSLRAIMERETGIPFPSRSVSVVIH